ncbi:MAG: CBS domain-containing protein [Thermodesulfobacteriota bacterium]
MKNVRDLLLEKGGQVHTVSPDATVYEALQLMADRNIGALVVCDGKDMKGLFSERDYARKIVLKGKLSKEIRVREIMTTEIIHVTPDQDIETCMELMSHHHIRHLPVLEQGRLSGLVSIGDVVKAIIEHKEEIIEQLESYIKGKR